MPPKVKKIFHKELDEYIMDECKKEDEEGATFSK